jgi:sialate O-acetylesterase
MSFSAIGFYFAKELMKHISTPIGLVMMAAGGVCLRELMPMELAHSLGYEKGANTRIAGCFDSLINPIIPLPFKAQIFFQGESEGCWFSCARQYDTDLKAYFDDERARFGQNFPVYNVQLSEYGENCKKYFPALDIVRVKQFDALSLVDDMTLTVDMDLGIVEGYDWAHSPRKFELAERLAKLALAKEYGIGRVMDAVSPRPLCAKLSADKSEIVIDFTDLGTGLIVKGQDPRLSIGLPVSGFSVGVYDGSQNTRMPAEATVTSRSQVTVKVPEGADTRFVNYCFAINVDPELYNGNNLPCPAFAIPVFE